MTLTFQNLATPDWVILDAISPQAPYSVLSLGKGTSGQVSHVTSMSTYPRYPF